MTFDPDNSTPPGATIKVIGVGGGGGNAVNTMIRGNLDGADFVCCNTDVQALRLAMAPHKVQIGKELTRGLGAGADPDIGRDAALEDRHDLQEVLSGADMVFITAGMGGGTGTGGASVVAQIARELGALTVAVVTKPFTFEGKRRRKHADTGITRLRECVDTLITIPNQRLLSVASPDLSMVDAFKMADEVLVNAVKGISDIINIPGTVNVDFADVKTIMSCMGQALMGIGTAEGEGRAETAAEEAINSPLLEDIDIEGATGILINITAGANVGLMEVNQACSVIQEAAHEDANIIFGAVIDENLGDAMRVTVIATGFPVENDEPDAVESVKQQQSILHPFSTRLTEKPEPSRAAIKPETQAHDATETNEPSTLSASPVSGEPVNERTSAAANPFAAAPKPDTPAIEDPLAPRSETPEAECQASHTPASATPNPGNEAEHLAEMTVSGSHGDELDGNRPKPDLGASASQEPSAWQATGGTPSERPQSPAPEADTEKDTESRIEGARYIPGLEDDFDSEEEAKDPGFSLTREDPESLERPPAAEASTPASESKAETQGATAGEPETQEGPAPMDSYFENSDAEKIAGDIDQKIDEALELAERMKSSDEGSKDKEKEKDDLDVPAFLRGSLKDLSLD